MSESNATPASAQAEANALPVETVPAPKVTSIQELRAKAKLPAIQVGGSTVQRFFESNKSVLAALLPTHITPDRMLKIALGALRTTPKLMECSVESLFGAVVKCSQMGLEPNTYAGHVFLIPFFNSRRNITEVQVIPGYKGLVELARRSGIVTSIFTQVRYAKDEWRLRYGSDPEIHHIPCDEDERGAIMGFYAVARLKDEEAPQFEYMRLSEIEKIRDASGGYRAAVATAKKYNKAVPDTPWVTNFEMMGRKTPLRRLANMLPQSVELAHAVSLDNIAEKGMSQALDRVLDGEWTPADVEAEAEVVTEAKPPQSQEPTQAEGDKQDQQRGTRRQGKVTDAE